METSIQVIIFHNEEVENVHQAADNGVRAAIVFSCSSTLHGRRESPLRINYLMVMALRVVLRCVES